MASYTVARAKHATLVASTADTVTFSTVPQYVEVVNHDAAAFLYVRTDGVAPTDAGDDNYVVNPNGGLILPLGAGTVKVLGSGTTTPKYSVTAVPLNEADYRRYR